METENPLESIHWYVTDRCNMNCAYCFKPPIPKAPEKNLEQLAVILANNAMKKVTITGGEPFLVKSLDRVLRILKEGGVYTSVHTNGLLLDYGKIARFKDIVRDVAIPLDSFNEKKQRVLRKENFVSSFKRIFYSLTEAGIPPGVHTVMTSLNFRDVESIYNFLNKSGFGYWRIYEFNPNLVLDKFSSRKKFFEVLCLEGESNYEKGCTDSLPARFLLAEEKIKKMSGNDPRIQFVTFRDPWTDPYIFLDPAGNVLHYSWFSSKREKIGNMLEEGFDKVAEKIRILKDTDPWDQDGEGFLEATLDQPIWARLYDGSFFEEELEEINPRYWEKVLHLNELYHKRNGLPPLECF